MDIQTREAIRANARAMGLVLQVLAVVTLIATIYAAFRVANFFTANSVSGSGDPAPWIIIVVGVLVSVTLAGLGYALAMLCAVYDQNGAHLSHTLSMSRSLTSAPTPNTATRPPSTRVTSPVPPRPTLTAPLSSRPTILGKPAAPAPETKSRLWRELTRERHFFR